MNQLPCLTCRTRPYEPKVSSELIFMFDDKKSISLALYSSVQKLSLMMMMFDEAKLKSTILKIGHAVIEDSLF